MLKNIHLHVAGEESRQHEVEQQAADFMASRRRQNINALKRYMPNLLQYLQAPSQTSVSLLCNKHGEINLIDYQSGRVFYSEFPQAEAARQVEQFAQTPLYVPLVETIDTQTTITPDFLEGLDYVDETTEEKTYKNNDFDKYQQFRFDFRRTSYYIDDDGYLTVSFGDHDYTAGPK